MKFKAWLTYSASYLLKPFTVLFYWLHHKKANRELEIKKLEHYIISSKEFKTSEEFKELVQLSGLREEDVNRLIKLFLEQDLLLVSDPPGSLEIDNKPKIEEIIKALKSNGRLNLNYNKSMKQGKTSRIEASIFKDAGEGLKQVFTETYKLSVAPVMKVELTGKHFEITPLSKNDEQLIAGDEPSLWKWDVKPLKYGKHTLEVTASICIPVEPYGKQYRNFDALKEQVHVSVNVPVAVKDGIVENWKWATAIVGLTGLILAYLNYTGFFK